MMSVSRRKVWVIGAVAIVAISGCELISGLSGLHEGTTVTGSGGAGGSSATTGTGGGGGPPTCTDGVKDVPGGEAETDVDCGGATCRGQGKLCADGKSCVINGDCANDFCNQMTNTCATATCTDTFQNGDETDVDCGGSCTTKCGVGEACSVAADCSGGTCCGNVCINVPAGPFCSALGANCPSSTMTCSVSGCSSWATWPMPNPASTGLPHPASYDLGTPGVVIDQVTGLWWQQPIDVDNTQSKNCSAGCTQAEALTYCANLALAGHCDWRLPTRIELVSILDYTHLSPAINGTAFPGTPLDYFWTSSAYAGSAGVGWIVYFSVGHTGHGGVADTYRVRCVR